MQQTPDVELLGPPRFSWPLSIAIWAAVAALLAMSWHGSLHAGIGRPGNSWTSLWVLTAFIMALAIAMQITQFTGRDIVLSVEGVRKGKGPRARFIPWRGATLRYDHAKGCFVIYARGTQITFATSNFRDDYRFREIMSYLRYVIYRQGLASNVRAAHVSAPLYRLSAADKAEFLAYRAGLSPYMTLPLFAACAAYIGIFAIVLRHPPPGSAAGSVMNAILQAVPFLFSRPFALVIYPAALMILLVMGFGFFDIMMSRRPRKERRAAWLAEFDRTQSVSINEVGLTCRDSEGLTFFAWNDIVRVSRTRGLILFQVVPDLNLSVVLPLHVFASSSDAADFLRRAKAFRRAALTRPNLIEPVSFWEIA